MLGLITYSVILLALLVGTWRRPAIGLAAVLCLYGLKQWGQSATQIFSEYRQFTNFAVFVICLLGIARAASRRGCLFCRTPALALLVLVLYAYAFVTILWAPDIANSFDQWVSQMPYLVTITLLSPLLLDDLDEARAAFRATVIAGASLCVLALVFGHWGDRGLVLFGHAAGEDDNNIYRYETNPLALSTLGATVFVIAALSLARPNRLAMRAFAMACIPAALGVILKSGSRGQLLAAGLALFVGLPIAFQLREAKSLAKPAAVALAVAGLAWWGFSLVHVDSSRWSGARTSEDVEGRFTMAQTLLGASARSPFTALFGLGNSSAFKVLGIYPHITGLEVLAEEGLFGASFYGAILFLAFRSVRRISRQDLSPSQRQGLATLTGLFVLELVLSWKQGTLLFSVYVFAYAIMLARFEANVREHAAEPIAAAFVPRFQNILR